MGYHKFNEIGYSDPKKGKYLMKIFRTFYGFQYLLAPVLLIFQPLLSNQLV